MSTTLLSISCRIHVIYLLMMSSLVCALFSQTLFHHLISQTEHLNTSGITSHGTDSFCIKPITPWPSYSQDLNLPDYLPSGSVPERQNLWKQSQTREDIIRKEICRIPFYNFINVQYLWRKNLEGFLYL